jgi:hypothetical protein
MENDITFTIDDLVIGIEYEPQFTFLRYPNHRVDFVENDHVVSKSADRFVADFVMEPRSILPIVIIAVNTKVIIAVNTNYYPRYIQLDGKVRKLFRNISVDRTNLEIKTNPTCLRNLRFEIEAADLCLQDYTVMLKQNVGSTGIFFPRSRLCLEEMVVVPIESSNYMYRFSLDKRRIALDSKPVLIKPFIKTSYRKFELGKFTPSKHVNISFERYRNRRIKAWTGVNNTSYRGILFKNITGSIHGRLHLTVPYNFTDYEGLANVVVDCANNGLFDNVHHSECHSQKNYEFLDPNFNFNLEKVNEVSMFTSYEVISAFLAEWWNNNPMLAPIHLGFVGRPGKYRQVTKLL